MTKITTKIEAPTGEDSPAVLAYRVGRLEKAVDSGFKAINEKLERMDGTYATHKDIENAQDQAALEHRAIYEELGRVKKEVHGIKKRNWVQNTLSAILGSVITFLAIYVVTDIISK